MSQVVLSIVGRFSISPASQAEASGGNYNTITLLFQTLCLAKKHTQKLAKLARYIFETAMIRFRTTDRERWWMGGLSINAP